MTSDAGAARPLNHASPDVRTTPADPRPSWPMVAAVLIACVALMTTATAKPFVGLPIMMAAFLLAKFTRLRLPKNAALVWILRSVLLFAVIATSGHRRSRSDAWFLEPDYINLFGYLCMGELLVQCWTRHVRGVPRGELVILSGLIMAASTNTYDRKWIVVLAPAYVLCLILALREAPHVERPSDAQRRLIWRRRGIGIAVAMVFGAFVVESLKQYGERVTIWPLSNVFRRPNRMSLSGLSTAPRLQSSFNLRPSPTRVLLIESTAAEGHWRGLAFEQYDLRNGGSWGPPYESRGFDLVADAALNPKDAVDGVRTVRVQRITDPLNLVYAPLNAAGVVPMPLSLTERDAAAGTLRSHPPEDNKAYAYHVALPRSLTHQGPMAPPMTPERRRDCLQVPQEIEKELKGLLPPIPENAPPLRRIRLIANLLQANHAYTTRVGPMPEGDRVVSFLRDKRAAHCQYFASAAVLLLRTAGVPARLATGYFAHERGGDAAMIVRQRDAHAWAEAYVDGVGWVTVDATPAAGRPDQLFEDVGRWQRFQEWMSDANQRFRAWLMNLDWRKVIPLALGALVLWQTRDWWRRLLGLKRRRAATLASRAAEDPLLASLGQQFEALLKDNGVAPAAHRTWREHARALPPAAPLDRVTIDEFIAAYDEVRFGGRTRDEQRLRALLGRIRLAPSIDNRA